MADSQTFTLQNLHDFYKSSQSNTNYENLSYNSIADLFILKNLVISEHHQKVQLAFKNLNNKIQRNKNQIRKFSKFKDNEGEKVILEISTSVMDGKVYCRLKYHINIFQSIE